MPRSRPIVLIVDPDSRAARELATFLDEEGFEVLWLSDGAGALNAIDDRRIDCLVTELKSQRIDGMAILRHARTRHPQLCAVVVSETPEIERAVEAMREGAYDFQTRPLHQEKLLAVLQRGLRDQGLAARIEEMEGRLDERFGIRRLTGASRAINRVMEQVSHIASARSTVLIEGESGTGKALLARVIHHHSARKLEPFVWANCGALPAGSVEAELFGLERDEAGAAGGVRAGRFELAEGGTLFLDEVDSLPAPVQIRLLRAVQELTFERVGGRDALRADVRLIVATDHDLERAAREGRFRQDLFERLSVARIHVPPLRERREDIPALADTFIRELNRQHGRHVRGLSRGALDALDRHHWPGNVRELKVMLEGMVVFAEGRRPLQWSDLPQALRGGQSRPPGGLAPGMTVAEAERALIEVTLEHTGGDKSRASAMLGIGLRTLYRKIKEFGLG